jgi:hypothetical protein
LLPSWQTTTVPESCGTTTVVFFSGGGGLELLMQPDKRNEATKTLDNTFISDTPVWRPPKGKRMR